MGLALAAKEMIWDTAEVNDVGDIKLLEVTASEDEKYRIAEEKCKDELQAIAEYVTYLENLYDMMPGDGEKVLDLVYALTASMVDKANL